MALSQFFPSPRSSRLASLAALRRLWRLAPTQRRLSTSHPLMYSGLWRCFSSDLASFAFASVSMATAPILAAVSRVSEARSLKSVKLPLSGDLVISKGPCV